MVSHPQIDDPYSKTMRLPDAVDPQLTIRWGVLKACVGRLPYQVILPDIPNGVPKGTLCSNRTRWCSKQDFPQQSDQEYPMVIILLMNDPQRIRHKKEKERGHLLIA